MSSCEGPVRLRRRDWPLRQESSPVLWLNGPPQEAFLAAVKLPLAPSGTCRPLVTPSAPEETAARRSGRIGETPASFPRSPNAGRGTPFPPPYRARLDLGEVTWGL